MKKKSGEMIVFKAKPQVKSQFPLKAKPEFLALRKWLDENRDRDIFEIVEDDRKLIYGKMRQKAIDEGNIDALKALLNKMFPDLRIEQKFSEERYIIEERVNNFLRDYGMEDKKK